MTQDLVLWHMEKGRNVNDLQRFHLPVALQHSRHGRRSEPEMASEIRLRSTDARQGLIEPGTVHNAPFTIQYR
jgi:hypothetical protein